MPALLARLTLIEPAATDAAASPWRWVSTALQLLWVVFLFALVLFLAYVTTRVVGRRLGGGGGAGRYLRVIDSAPLGQNRSVALVEVGDEVYCVGITEHGVNLLGKHERAALSELAPRETPTAGPAAGDFAGLLAGFSSAARDTVARLRPTRTVRATAPAPTPPPTAASTGANGDFAARMREQIARLQRLEEPDRSDGQGGPAER